MLEKETKPVQISIKEITPEFLAELNLQGIKICYEEIIHYTSKGDEFGRMNRVVICKP